METSTSPIPCAAPDWSSLTEDVLCPLCEYNLRGLIEPRCPECGYEFEWPRLLDVTQRLHPYLFEHHPERNGGSFLQTIIGSCNPKRFWKTLHPSQPSNLRRLLVYWLMQAALVLIFSLVIATPYLYEYYERAQAQRRMMVTILVANPAQRARIVSIYGSVDAYVKTVPGAFSWQILRETISRSSQYLPFMIGAVAYMIWPWVGLVLLMIFQQSMRRARIRSAHVLRCLIYSTDALPLLLLGILPLGGMILVHSIRDGDLVPWFIVLRWLQNLGPVVVPIIWIVATWRLVIAYRRYLQFPHSVAVVIVSEFILALAVLCILSQTMRDWDFIRMLHLPL